MLLKRLFPDFFPKIEKLEKNNDKRPYQEVIDWFFNESGFDFLDDASDKEYKKQLDSIIPLKQLVLKYQPDVPKEDQYFLKEFIFGDCLNLKS